ncbi:thiol S-methyltransferase TMT1A-like [Argopecten irradians]|uniref:thiol S-methyltransferase TMT1A-like n=1 Tax=Argopecten irradians TaxID=31199 RepID=UPI0037246946
MTSHFINRKKASDHMTNKMAEQDVAAQGYLKSTLYIGLAIFVGYFCLKKHINRFRLRLFAWVLAKFGCKSNKLFGEHKKKLFHSMKELRATIGPLNVLEIGVGGGANFKFYPPQTKVTCLDPNPYFESYTESNAADTRGVEMTGFIQAYAEKMDGVRDCSFDVVVSTLVLCSVKDQNRVLEEVKRVLKHNGKFYFLDHVCAPKQSIIYFFQCLMSPLWRVIGDGCELTRDTGSTVKAAGFKLLDMRTFTAQTKMFLIRPCCMGIATKE